MSSNRERQLAELVLLQSMYPDEFEWQTPHGSEPSLDELEATDPSVTLKIERRYISHTLSYHCRPNIPLTRIAASYTLSLTLPATYPTHSPPTAYLHCAPDIPTATRKAARQLLTDTLSSLESGIESLDLLVTSLTASLATLVPPPSPDQNPTTNPISQEKSEPIRLQLFWAHHLLATSKRKDIQSWSRELHLTGWARPGHPGAVLVEGSASSVAEFERRIKALRWQALQVRGSIDGPERSLDAGQGVVEVQELSEIVSALRTIDDSLADWFLSGMKIGHA
ncbi:hypothetical protein ANO11243_076820 [Dothideomycetidae sp. 11243]|nr:hypothetical protein ANO11243_076820 [fungal sp. No.11243]